MPQFSIIIPVFNKWELTRDCLASLREHGSGPSFEVIVIDNGSTDATATELRPYGKSLFDDRFHSIVLPENKNFGPACNIGAKAAKSPVLFFLNNDTLVTPGWAEPLLNALLEDESLGAVGPLLLYPNDTVQHLGVAFGAVGPVHLYCGFPKDHPVVHAKRDLQAMTGAALMIRAELFQACGEFFEEYRNGFEDLELCHQIRKQRKTLRCIPESKIYHLESQTPNRKEGDERNGRLFTHRCAGKIYIDQHTHALNDNFEPFITDLLSIGVRMRHEDELALAMVANNKSGETWLHLITQNPLWINGREILAGTLENSEDFAEAIAFYIQLLNIEPLRHRFQKLLSLAPFAGENAPWLPYVQDSLHHIDTYMISKTFAEKSVRQILGKFMPCRDAFLQNAYAEKLKQFFPA